MKILLLAGGDSSEREVSLASSRAIYDSLKRQDHEVHVIDPASGKSLLGPDGLFLECDQDSTGRDVPVRTAVDTAALGDALGSEELRDVDVVLIGLHGGAGENGSLQNLLDLAGLTYTGSNMLASAVAMNKAMTKRLMKSAGIETPKWAIYRVRGEKPGREVADDIVSRFGFPIIVKPNDGGSTVGLTKVESPDELQVALERSAEESPEILVESYISGRELTVAVLDGEALPVVEIKPKNELYDYEAKYTSGKSEYVAPAKIDDGLAGRLQHDAKRVYEMVGASGAARIDFLVDSEGQHFCLELNTLPGMTNLSLVPMAAKCVGIDFDGLVDRIIRSALNK